MRTCSVDIGFHQNVHATDPIQGDLYVFVISPITHTGHVCSIGLVFLVTCIRSQQKFQQSKMPQWTVFLTFSEHNISIERV